MDQEGFSKLTVIIFVLIITALGGYFLWNQNSQNVSSTQDKNLLICDPELRKKVLFLEQEHGVVKDIREKSAIIVGFYTTRDNLHLKETYRDLEQAIQYGWGDFYDFIEDKTLACFFGRMRFLFPRHYL